MFQEFIFGKSYLTNITLLVNLCIYIGLAVQISELALRFGQKVSMSLSSNFLLKLSVKMETVV